jgi:hypothetical protein
VLRAKLQCIRLLQQELCQLRKASGIESELIVGVDVIGWGYLFINDSSQS